MKLKKEDLFSSLIGLAPVFIIAIVFKNDSVACLHYAKQYMSICSSILTFIGIMEILESLKKRA